MRFKLEIEMDGAAFNPDWRPELAELLAQLARDIGEGKDANRRLLDVNGNSVGESEVMAEPSNVGGHMPGGHVMPHR